MAGAHEAAVSSHRAESYSLGAVLGRGTFGDVYAGRCLSDGRAVAVKAVPKRLLADGASQDALRREVTILRRLNHPNVLSLLDAYEDAGAVYLVTELCGRGELLEHVRSRGGLPEAEAAALAAQLAAGLAYLHANAIMHRDIKLANLLLTDDGQLKIADFGLAAALDSADSERVTLCGTPNYLAPEVAAGRPYGLAADAWSLGVALFTMLAGKPPFQGVRVADTLANVREGRYGAALPESAGIHARALVESLLQADPTARPTLAQVLSHPFLASSGATAVADARTTRCSAPYVEELPCAPHTDAPRQGGAEQEQPGAADFGHAAPGCDSQLLQSGRNLCLSGDSVSGESSAGCRNRDDSPSSTTSTCAGYGGDVPPAGRLAGASGDPPSAIAVCHFDISAEQSSQETPCPPRLCSTLEESHLSAPNHIGNAGSASLQCASSAAAYAQKESGMGKENTAPGECTAGAGNDPSWLQHCPSPVPVPHVARRSNDSMPSAARQLPNSGAAILQAGAEQSHSSPGEATHQPRNGVMPRQLPLEERVRDLGCPKELQRCATELCRTSAASTSAWPDTPAAPEDHRESLAGAATSLPKMEERKDTIPCLPPMGPTARLAPCRNSTAFGHLAILGDGSVEVAHRTHGVRVGVSANGRTMTLERRDRPTREYALPRLPACLTPFYQLAVEYVQLVACATPRIVSDTPEATAVLSESGDVSVHFKRGSPPPTALRQVVSVRLIRGSQHAELALAGRTQPVLVDVRCAVTESCMQDMPDGIPEADIRAAVLTACKCAERCLRVEEIAARERTAHKGGGVAYPIVTRSRRRL